MKCKNCGAPLSMTQKFCSNCGVPNEQSRQHIKDMEKYDKKFTQTQTEVVRNSKWFVKYIAPITAFVIALSAAMFAWFSNDSMWEYTFERKVSAQYNASHSEQINDQLHDMLKDRRYYETYLMKYRLERTLAEEEDHNSWNYYYELAQDYQELRESIILYFDPVFESSYSKQSAISKAARAICSAKQALQVTSASAKAIQESIPYIEDLRSDMYTFLKAYCNFTQEDIESLPDKDETAVTALLTRRMFDEKNE